MNRYEAMFLFKANLDEKTTNTIVEQIKESITKNEGNIVSSKIWAENKKLCFPIKNQLDATYYLINFMLKPALVDSIKQAYRLNENVLRVTIFKEESKVSKK